METYPRIKYQESVEPKDDSNTVVKNFPIFLSFSMNRFNIRFKIVKKISLVSLRIR